MKRKHRKKLDRAEARVAKSLRELRKLKLKLRREGKL